MGQSTKLRTYTPPDRKAEARIQREARELSQDAVAKFRDRVVRRLEAAPRFQSIGRMKYVYVEDVAQIMDEELYGGSES